MTEKNANFEKLIPNAEGIFDVSVEEFKKNFGSCHSVDVRRPDEWVSELGHIKGVQFATLETDLMKFLDSVPATQKSDTWVFVCRSGGRSARAAAIAQSKGFSKAYNMMGGMICWNAAAYEVSREKA